MAYVKIKLIIFKKNSNWKPAPAFIGWNEKKTRFSTWLFSDEMSDWWTNRGRYTNIRRTRVSPEYYSCYYSWRWGVAREPGIIRPTRCILLENLFNPSRRRCRSLYLLSRSQTRLKLYLSARLFTRIRARLIAARP